MGEIRLFIGYMIQAWNRFDRAYNLLYLNSLASQAHPLPLWQLYDRLMQESPQAFPLLHTLQHSLRDFILFVSSLWHVVSPAINKSTMKRKALFRRF